MKKSVILTIAAIYLASIVVVGFFGMRIMSYNETVYIERIELETYIAPLDVQMKTDEDGSLYAIIEYRENLVVPLEYRVFPADATNREGVEFHCSKPEVARAEKGMIFINKPKEGVKSMTTMVYLKTTDGGNKSTSVQLIIRVKK